MICERCDCPCRAPHDEMRTRWCHLCRHWCDSSCRGVLCDVHEATDTRVLTCERCGHEHERLVDGYGRLTNDYAAHQINECIANLRTDLAEAREERLRLLREAVIAEEAMIRHREAVEKDLEAERARSWELAARLEPILIWDYPLCQRHETPFGGDALCPSCAKETAEERAARAEAQCAAMRAVCEVTRARLLGRNDPLLDQLEKASHDDAGRDLLTAVRRLCEAARMVLHEDIHEEHSYGALNAAFADPALAGLLPPEMQP